jgi:hypothetical protein
MIVMHRPFPSVNRTDGRNGVPAGGKTFFDERSGELDQPISAVCGNDDFTNLVAAHIGA